MYIWYNCSTSKKGIYYYYYYYIYYAKKKKVNDLVKYLNKTKEMETISSVSRSSSSVGPFVENSLHSSYETVTENETVTVTENENENKTITDIDVDTSATKDALNLFGNESNELVEEAKKMIERNRKHTKITENTKTIEKKSNNEKKENIIKPMRRTITKFKNISKRTALKTEIDMGKKLAEEMLNEISEKRKEKRKRLEMKKEKRIEGEIRVGKLTVIKDISKMRKCDKKMKDKIYKLSNEAIDRIMKRK